MCDHFEGLACWCMMAYFVHPLQTKELDSKGYQPWISKYESVLVVLSWYSWWVWCRRQNMIGMIVCVCVCVYVCVPTSVHTCVFTVYLMVHCCTGSSCLNKYHLVWTRLLKTSGGCLCITLCAFVINPVFVCVSMCVCMCVHCVLFACKFVH